MEIIKLDKGTKKLLGHEQCHRCREIFILNDFMIRFGFYYFHLTCFKKYSENEIEKHENDIKEIRDSINLLEPYKKEMICETLLKEKYG
jgi:hypothetical protein